MNLLTFFDWLVGVQCHIVREDGNWIFEWKVFHWIHPNPLNTLREGDMHMGVIPRLIVNVNRVSNIQSILFLSHKFILRVQSISQISQAQVVNYYVALVYSILLFQLPVVLFCLFELNNCFGNPKSLLLVDNVFCTFDCRILSEFLHLIIAKKSALHFSILQYNIITFSRTSLIYHSLEKVHATRYAQV